MKKPPLPIDHYLNELAGPAIIAQHHPHTWRLLHEAFRLSYGQAAQLLGTDPEEVERLLGGATKPSPKLLAQVYQVYGVSLIQGPGLPSERPLWELCPRGLQIASAGVRMKAPRLAEDAGLSDRFVRQLMRGPRSECGPPAREALGLVLGVTLFNR